jgi:hypothetical protein
MVKTSEARPAREERQGGSRDAVERLATHSEGISSCESRTPFADREVQGKAGWCPVKAPSELVL